MKTSVGKQKSCRRRTIAAMIAFTVPLLWLVKMTLFVLIFAVPILFPHTSHFELDQAKVANSPLGDSVEGLSWFVHVSDLHITEYNEERTERIRQFLNTTLKRAIQPEFVVCTGDVTDGILKSKRCLEGGSSAPDARLSGTCFMPGQQNPADWATYRGLLEEAGMRRRSYWFDTKGNHDDYGVREASDVHDLFSIAGVNGFNSDAPLRRRRRLEGVEEISELTSHVETPRGGSIYLSPAKREGYTMAYTTKSGSYLIAVMDQPQTPGLSPPVNFFTTLSSLSKEYLQNAAENAAKADLSFLAGHYPISSFSDKTNYFLESYLIDSPFAAYLCGHYHLPKALFRREDVLELEVGDMKSSGQYRVMAVDNGVFSFADQNSDEFPVVVMTNPKPANIMTRKEKLEYMTGSSHVRVLAFSDMDISRVYMQVDGGVEREMSQVQPGHPLFVVGWNAVDYGIGLHTLTVRVTDQAGREKRVVEQFSLDGTAPSPATFVTFFLILDQPELVRFLYIFCVVVVLILRLLLPKMWVGVSMCLKGSRSSHELLNKVEGVEEGRDAEDSESTRRKKGREIIFVETKGVTAQSRGPVVRVNTEESVVVDSDEDSEIEGREEEEEVEEGDAVVYSEGRRKRRSVEGEDVTEYGDIELGNVGSSRGEGKAGRTSSAVLEGDGESNGREKGRQRAVSKDDEMGGQVTGETSKVRSGGVTGRGGKASEEIDANDSDHDRIGTVVEGSARGVVDGHSDEVEDEENGDVNHVRAPAEKRRGRCAEKTGRFMLAISKEIRYTVRRYSNMPAKYWIPLTIICLLMCIMPIVAGPIMGGGHVGLLLPFGKAVLLRSPVEVLVSSSPSSPSLPSQPFQSKGNTSMVTAPLVVIEEPRAAVMSSYLLILVHLPAMALISVTLPPRRSQRGWAKVEKGGKRAVVAGVGNFDKALRKKTVMLLLTFVVGSAAWLGVIATGFSLATLLFSPATYYVLTDWVLFVHVMVAQRRSSYHQLGAAR